MQGLHTWPCNSIGLMVYSVTCLILSEGMKEKEGGGRREDEKR